MLLHGFCISRLGLFLSFSTFLTPLSPATLNLLPAPASQASPGPTSQRQDQVYELVGRVLHHADKVGCKKNSCTILVTNFTLSSGATSRFGMQLADQISEDLASTQPGIRIVERSRLQSFLEQERIPASLFNSEKALCWLAKQLSATTVLRGTTEDRSGELRVQGSLLSCLLDKAGPVEEFTFHDSDARYDLAPQESFPETLSPPSSSPAIPLIRVAGVDGVSAPACVHCPNPSYTDPARVARINGTVLLRLTVSEEGRMTEARVVRGLPFGLNESAMKVVRDWQFKPAKRDGQSVTCMVMTEVTFRLR